MFNKLFIRSVIYYKYIDNKSWKYKFNNNYYYAYKIEIKYFISI